MESFVPDIEKTEHHHPAQSRISKINQLLVISTIFVLTRYVITHLYAYDFNLYCGDSGNYLDLATHLDQALFHKPSGYAFFLSLFSSQSGPTLLRFVPLIQMLLSLISIIIFFKITSTVSGKPRLALFFSLLLVLYPHCAFMEMFYMPDSISNSIMITLLACSLLRDYKFATLLCIGLLLGYLPLLRTNHLLFTLFLGLVFIQKILILDSKPLLKVIRICAVVLPCFILIFWYRNVFVVERLGVAGLNHLGGRMLFANIAQNFSCEELGESFSFDQRFSGVVASICTEEMLNGKYTSNWLLWAQESLIKSIDRWVILPEAQTDVIYKKACVNLLSSKPFVFFEILYRNLLRSIEHVHLDFYRNNYSPAFVGECFTALTGYFHIPLYEYAQKTSLNLKNNYVNLFSDIGILFKRAIILVNIPFLFLPLIVYFRNRLGIDINWIEISYIALLYFMVISFFLVSVFLTYSSPRQFHALYPIYITIGFVFFQKWAGIKKRREVLKMP